jgi:hypothetical protein
MNAQRKPTDWPKAIAEARFYVHMWEGRVTLGMAYHYLVQTGLIPDNRGSYRYLSELTKRGRRAGTFPEFGVARGGVPIAVTSDMALAAEAAYVLAQGQPGLAPWRAALEAALEVAP